MTKEPNSCKHQFTSNMCGRPEGCSGCSSYMEEILIDTVRAIPADGQENPAMYEEF